MAQLQRPPLPWAKRIWANLMDQMLFWMEGYKAPFGHELYRTYTFGQVMEWNRRIMGVIKAMERDLGPWQGQLCIALSAVWNGCEYCARGHSYASNLLYFKSTGKLLPLDEQEVHALQRLKDDGLMNELRKRFAGEEHAALLVNIERMYVLHEDPGAKLDQPNDALLGAVNAAWAWINECSVISPTTPVPPLNSIGKNGALIVQYHAARGRKPPL